MLDIQVIYIPSNARDIHSWAAILNNKCIGNVHLQLEPNKKLKLLDAWVEPEYRRQGVYRQLWDARWDYVKEHYIDYKSYAWCKPMSLPLLIEKGFKVGETCVYVSSNVKN